MKIIINASNLRVGGAVQVTLSVVNELHAFPDKDFHIFLSPGFKGLISEDVLSQSHIKIYWVEFPSRFTISGRVPELDLIEEKINADVVFSIFAPTYWKPKAPHLAGFAQGYYLYNHLPYFKKLGLIEKFRLFLLSRYHKFLLKRHVQEFVVETDDVKERLQSFLNIAHNKVHVATNTYSSFFKDVEIETSSFNFECKSRPFKMLTVAYPYPHKNLTVFKQVSKILNSSGICYQFYITVNNKYYKEHFSGFENEIINIGPIKNEDCPHIYNNCDAMILPSLVECFSASYPEAMKMRRPILTSDYSFSRSVCKEAALYFDAFDPEDIALKIRKLAESRPLYESLVSSGSERLEYFLSPSERCSKYIELVFNMRNK